MREPSWVLAVFLVLGFGVYLVVPAEDVPETPYDESETVPYESAPLFLIVMPLAAARITHSELTPLHHKTVAPLLSTPARVRETAAHRSAGRALSALLCMLLC